MAKLLTVRSRSASIDLAYIILAAFLLRILPILLGSPAASDINYYKAQAVPVLNNQNIYAVTRGVFPYSPFTMFVPALCLLFSNISSIPFHITMKIPALIGDISLSVAIYYWVILYKNDKEIAFKAAILYALNPVAILISAFQGNMMSIPTLFMFLAVMMIIYNGEKNYRLSALLLGLAIAFRGYPILLLPLILLKSGLSFSKKIKYVMYATLPVALIFLPFLILDNRSVFREIFGYGTSIEYGYGAIESVISLYSLVSSFDFTMVTGTVQKHLTYLTILLNHVPPSAIIMQLMAYSKAIFLAAYLIVILQYKRLGLLRLILATYLGFYFFYAHAASQYFIWIIPFVHFLDDRFSGWYIILGSYAIISVYLCYHPFTLFGILSISPYPTMKNIFLNEFIALSLFWSLCGVWFFGLLFNKERPAV